MKNTLPLLIAVASILAAPAAFAGPKSVADYLGTYTGHDGILGVENCKITISMEHSPIWSTDLASISYLTDENNPHSEIGGQTFNDPTAQADSKDDELHFVPEGDETHWDYYFGLDAKGALTSVRQRVQSTIPFDVIDLIPVDHTCQDLVKQETPAPAAAEQPAPVDPQAPAQAPAPAPQN